MPDWLRGRWKFHLGDARQILPPLARELPPLDLFTHDSLHTYEHMKFEFEQAFPLLRPGGILVADDALWNERSGILHAPRGCHTRKFFMV